MMIIKLIPYKNELTLKNWEQLEKVLYLTDNIDLSIPQFGILTNGFDWIIRDFIHQKWLTSIPNKKSLKSMVNRLKLQIIKIIKLIETPQLNMKLDLIRSNNKYVKLIHKLDNKC